MQIFQESSSLPLPLGKTLGDYTLRAVLGRGGQGVVYLAEPLQDGPTVAIKVPLALAETRLIREAQALEGLSGHPNIVDVLARNLDASPPHLVLEYLSEGSLAELMEAHPEGLDEDRVVDIALDVLEALDFAHSKGVIHRDLKPSNVLIRGDTYQVADFGLGKQLDPQAALSLSLRSLTGVAGTPLYLAPEQEDPEQREAVYGRCDLYSFGKLLYFLLSGQRPRTIRPLSQLRGGLAPLWETLIFDLVEDQPGRRPASAEAVMQRIDSVFRSRLVSREAATPGAPSRSARLRKRWPYQRPLTSSAKEHPRLRRSRLFGLVAVLVFGALLAAALMMY